MDWTQLGVNLITALTVPLTVVFIWAAKALFDKIPASVLPIAAPIIGILLDAAYSYFANAPFQSPLASAVAGCLAVWIHQLITQVPKGLQPAKKRALRF